MPKLLNIKQSTKSVEDMNFVDKAIFATINVLNNYFNLDGRASRPSFWYYFLVIMIMSILENIIGSITLGSWLHVLVVMMMMAIGVALFLPGLGVVVRRLHDTGKSGWWFFITFIPLIGALIMLILLIAKGDAGDNEYGAPDNTFY